MLLHILLYLWLTAFSVAPNAASNKLVLEWSAMHQRDGLTGFYVYRQTDSGWVSLTESHIPKTDLGHDQYRIRDQVPCDRTYTYLLRAFGQTNGQSYFEDWRVNNTYLPCANGPGGINR